MRDIFDVCKNRTNNSGSRLKSRGELWLQEGLRDAAVYLAPGNGPFLCPAGPSVSRPGWSELVPESEQTAPGKASVPQAERTLRDEAGC